MSYIVMGLKKVYLFSGMSKEERPRQVKILILEKLPEDNYQILKYIVQFLSKVSI
jgi:Rho GTPase-activating protein 1